MKYTVLFFLSAALALSAQELTPRISEDLASLLSAEHAAAVLRHEKALGKAFNRALYRQEAARILRSGQELPDPQKSACPEAAEFANNVLHFYEGDVDPELLLSKTDQMLQRGDWGSHAFEQEMQQLRFRLRRDYLPLLRVREQQREKKLLAANALRDGVTVLPNGIQYEVEPGSDSIRDITRGTSESGILFFTRVTNDMRFESLPACLRDVADSLPCGRSWVIYIPGPLLTQEAEAARRQEAEDQQRREAKLRSLLGSVPPPPAPAPRTSSAPEPLLKLRLWKDDPDHPVDVLPDTHTDAL